MVFKYLAGIGLLALGAFASGPICRCDNGLAASGKDCPYNNAHQCSACDAGYEMDHVNGICSQKQCVCPHGDPAVGVDCPNSGDLKCSDCKCGYEPCNPKNNPFVTHDCCLIKCQCENGTARLKNSQSHKNPKNKHKKISDFFNFWSFS